MRPFDDLSLYAYGLMDEADERALELHLESCADCSELVRKISSERRFFKEAFPRLAPDPEERAQVTLRILSRQPIPPLADPPLPRKRRGEGIGRPGLLLMARGVAAATVVLLLALLLTSSPLGPEIPKTEGLPTASPLPDAPAPRAASPRPILAFVQDAAFGQIAGLDLEGRPVGDLALESHHVRVEILDGIAKTTVEEVFRNHTDRRLEGSFQFPLPPDASISRLALEVNGKLEEGTCLERERAREVFESIVRRMRDPALLEWMPGGLFKCRIFPIEPRSTKRVLVAYTQALPYFRGKMTYVYPLVSEKTREHPPLELGIDVQARFTQELRKMESLSHLVDVHRRNDQEASLGFTTRNSAPKRDFVVVLETGDPELRILSHKTDGADGYFALLLSPQGAPLRQPGRYSIILDLSASVTLPELEVEKSLVRAILENRMGGDRFELLASNIEVTRSGEVDLRSANDFMDPLLPMGGSDLASALLAAPEGDIIYIGRGVPTYGETDPAKILEAARGRRLRTIGIGSRANTPLLEKLGSHLRINPSDNVPQRVHEIAATVGSPALSEIRVDGGEALYDVVGVRDIFYGERLVVCGRYRGPAAQVVVSGRGYRREAQVTLPMKEEANNYIRRLWAQRKVEELFAQGEVSKEAVTNLGVKYQIMTPYTSFLVLENEQMWKDHRLNREVQEEDRVLGRGRTPAGTAGQSSIVPAEEDLARPAQGPSIRPGPGVYSGMQPQEAASPRGGRFGSAGEPGPLPRGPLPIPPLSWPLINEPSNQIGRGLSAPETTRPESWDLRTQSFYTLEPGDSLQGSPPQLAGTFRPSRMGRSTDLPDEEVLLEIPTTANQFGGIDLSLSDVQRQSLQRIRTGKSSGPSAGAAERGFTRFELQSGVTGAVQSIDLPRFPDDILQMETRVSKLKHLQPSPIYSAKVEPGQFINGQPLVPAGDTEQVLKRWQMYRLIQNALTKDADGRILGKVDFDPQSNAFIVRDTPAAQDRVSKILEAYDVEPDTVAVDFQFITTTNEDLLNSVPAAQPGGQSADRFTQDLGRKAPLFFSPENSKRVFQALREDRSSHLIQAPTLLVSDNSEASIEIGDARHQSLYVRPKIVAEATKVVIEFILVPERVQGSDPQPPPLHLKLILPDRWTVALRSEVASSAQRAPTEQLLLLVTPRIVPREAKGPDELKRLLKLREDLEMQELAGLSGITAKVAAANESTNEITLDAGAARGVKSGQLFGITRDRALIAILQIRTSTAGSAVGGVWRGLALGRVLPSDVALGIQDLQRYCLSLSPVQRGMLGAIQKEADIRAKMGLRE